MQYSIAQHGLLCINTKLKMPAHYSQSHCRTNVCTLCSQGLWNTLRCGAFTDGENTLSDISGTFSALLSMDMALEKQKYLNLYWMTVIQCCT